MSRPNRPWAKNKVSVAKNRLFKFICLLRLGRSSETSLTVGPVSQMTDNRKSSEAFRCSYRALSFLTGTVWRQLWSGIGYPTAAVVSVKRAALNRAPKNAWPEVARMTNIDEQPHPVNRTSPVRLRERTHHSLSGCHRRVRYVERRWLHSMEACRTNPDA